MRFNAGAMFLVCSLALCCAARAAQTDLLGDEFRSPATGIALRPPVNCEKVDSNVPDQIAQFNDEDRHWVFKVSRLALGHPLPLTTYNDQFGREHDGLMETTLKQLEQQPVAQVVTQDIVHTGPGGRLPVGVIVIRYEQNLQRRLLQQALVEANDQLYYVIELNTPARTDLDGTDQDPGERLAADTFNQVIDSVQLLDRAAIYQDQADRLIRTRGLLANWTPEFLAARMDGERFYRLLRNGKDIGYTYEIDEYDDKDGKIADTPIVRVSTRSASAPIAGTVVEVQSRLMVTVDRKHENWASVAVISSPAADQNGEATGKRTLSQASEFGMSDESLKAAAIVPAGGGLDSPEGADNQEVQPGVRMKESWTLTVLRKSGDSPLPEFKQDLPPFYLPQALSKLLPRLLPFKEPRTYLFASYVPNGDSGRPAVMLRYVDVGVATNVVLDGKEIVAVPIRDRVGLEGTVTTHYVNPDDGTYLGTVVTVPDKDGTPTTEMILPTDAEHLHELWPNCILTRPDRIVDQPVVSP